LPVDDPLLKVICLRLLDDAGEGFDESAQDRRVLRRESVPVRAVEVREDLAVAVEDRDLVLANDDVVVHPDVSRDFPHDVLPLELVVPCDRHAARQALRTARRLVRAPSAAEEECNGNHRVHRTWMPVTAKVRVFHAVSKAAIASRHAFSAASRLFGSLASRTIGTTAAALLRDSSIAYSYSYSRSSSVSLIWIVALRPEYPPSAWRTFASSPSSVKMTFPIPWRPWILPSIAHWSRMSSKSPRTPLSWFASWIRSRLPAARMSS